MKLKIHGMYLDDRDLQLFRYLHAVKVATYGQIHRDIYTSIGLDSVGGRIRKLEDNRLLEAGRSRLLLNGARTVSLTRRAFDNFVKKGEEIQIELKSDAIQHDLVLVDIRHRFSLFQRTLDYQTENQIQTWDLKNRSLNCDAMMLFQLRSTPIQIPIEYEASLKKEDRYEPFLKKYYQNSEFPLILLLADTQLILDKIVKLEKELFNWDKPKFFYQLKQNFFKNEVCHFENGNQSTLTFSE